MTTTRKKGKTAKSGPNVMVGPKQVPVAKSNKPMKPKQPSQPKDLVAPFNPNSHPSRSPLTLISCVEFTRMLLISVPSLPSRPARSQSVLKIVILIVVENGSMA